MNAGMLCSDAGALFILKLPRITRDEYLATVLTEIMLLYKDGHAASCMVENLGAAHAIRTLIPNMVLYGAAGLNIFNHCSACRHSPTFRSLTLSPELSGDECRTLVLAAQNKGCIASFALIAQGIGEAMVTEDCLLEPMVQCRSGERDDAFFGIQDGTGHIFPLGTDGECRTRIGNAVETCLVDHLPAIQKAGISEIVIDARGRTAAYAGAMTRIYRDAIEEVETGTDSGNRAGQLKDRIKTLAYGGITTGHFLRGLKE
jgi:putative protease